MFISGMFHPLLRSAHCADHDGPRRGAASPPPCKWCSSDMGACFRRYSLPYEHPRSGGLSDPTAPPRPETQQSHQASDTPINSRWAHDAPDTDSLGGPPVRGRPFAAESPPHPEEGTRPAHLLHHVTQLSAHQFSTRGHKNEAGTVHAHRPRPRVTRWRLLLRRAQRRAPIRRRGGATKGQSTPDVGGTEGQAIQRHDSHGGSNLHFGHESTPSHLIPPSR